MSVREGDDACGSKDNNCIKCRLQEGSVVKVEEGLFTSNGKGETRRWGSRGAAAGEEVFTAGEKDWTAGAAEEEDGLSGCSIVGEAVGKVF